MKLPLWRCLAASLLIAAGATGCQAEAPEADPAMETETATPDGMPGGTGQGDAVAPSGTGTGLSGAGLMNPQTNE